MPVPYDKRLKYRLLDEGGFKKYFDGGRWTDFNRQFFDQLAPKYDRLNNVLSIGQHRRIKRQAVWNIGIAPRSRVLDLCTGSGDIAIAAAQKFPDGEIVGVDASEKMLQIARRRAEGFRNIHFCCADALHLPFRNDFFDAAVISFGLRNLDDLKEGILEMKRVTRPGGKIANLDMGRPSRGMTEWIYQIFFQKWIPFIGKAWYHRGEFNSFQYVSASAKYFPSQEELVEIFGELGLKEVRRYDFLFGAISEQIGTVL